MLYNKLNDFEDRGPGQNNSPEFLAARKEWEEKEREALAYTTPDPVVRWSKPCATCGGRLLRLVVGNIVDYRHDLQVTGAVTCRAA